MGMTITEKILAQHAGKTSVARVTSYNVCYTKLLRPRRRDALLGRADLVRPAGALPADGGGQSLIKHIVEISRRPEFVGKVIFLENYDMELARVTSYNVCYTKLLRLSSKSMASPQKKSLLFTMRLNLRSLTIS